MTPARSCPSPLATTWPAGWTPVTSPPSSPTTASRRTRRIRSPTISSPRFPTRCSNYDSAPAPPTRRDLPARPDPNPAPGARELLPGASGLVHGERSRQRQMGDRRIHRPPPRYGASARPAGRVVHPCDPRPERGRAATHHLGLGGAYGLRSGVMVGILPLA